MTSKLGEFKKKSQVRLNCAFKWRQNIPYWHIWLERASLLSVPGLNHKFRVCLSKGQQWQPYIGAHSGWSWVIKAHDFLYCSIRVNKNCETGKVSEVAIWLKFINDFPPGNSDLTLSLSSSSPTSDFTGSTVVSEVGQQILKPCLQGILVGIHIDIFVLLWSICSVYRTISSPGFPCLHAQKYLPLNYRIRFGKANC